MMELVWVSLGPVFALGALVLILWSLVYPNLQLW